MFTRKTDSDPGYRGISPIAWAKPAQAILTEIASSCTIGIEFLMLDLVRGMQKINLSQSGRCDGRNPCKQAGNIIGE
jgi:hypothetical protein